MLTTWPSITWPIYLAKYYARQLWRDMPGPWPVKLALIVICLLIPGPQDELLLIALVAAMRRYREAREGRV